MVAESSESSEGKEFIVVCLDLLSAMCEGLGGSFEATVKNSELFPLLLQCSRDLDHDVRQSSFALLGDLTKVSFDDLRPLMDDFMTILSQNMNLELISVCNNAIWAVGEISLKMGDGMRNYVPVLIERLIQILNTEGAQRTVLENTAITIGRLGLVAPNEVAPFLQIFVRQWCASMRNVRDNEQKESAFRGVCNLVLLNPEGVTTDFVYFCDAIASWSQPPHDLFNQFRFVSIASNEFSNHSLSSDSFDEEP
ncbi:Transportin-1 [Cichlidogyrus casuarinus]|uniref:Transportin-1 n=1 Tax=Cichlidogyrus casuarinus TaxID=1844966 RepID=A0ABD2Q981_9PLAT